MKGRVEEVFVLIVAASLALSSLAAAQIPTPRPYGECRAGVGPVPVTLTGGRLNDDTLQDVAFLDSQGDKINLFLSDAQLVSGICPTNLPGTVAIDGGNGGAIASLDIGRNNVTDLAVAQVRVDATSTDGMRVFRNSGGANPTFTQDGIRRSAAQSVATADFDADGIDDIAVGNTDGLVLIYYGLVGGGFEAPIATASEVPVDRLTVGNMDVDLFPDLVVLSGSPPNEGSIPRNSAIRVLLNTYTSALPRAPFDPVDPLDDVPEHPVSLAVGDFNDDGLEDLVIVDGPDVLLRLPTLTPSQTPSVTGTPSPTNTPDPATNTPTLTPTRTPTGAREATSTQTPTVTPTPSSTSTFTQTRTPIAEGAVIVYLADRVPRGGQPISFTRFMSQPAGRGASAVAVGDFNGDLRIDAVVSSITDDRLMFFMGDGTGRLTLQDPCGEDACANEGVSVLAGCCVGPGPRDILLTVIDGSSNARPDIFVANADGASLSVLLSSNPPPTSTVTVTPTGTITNTPGPTNTFTPIPPNTPRPTDTCPPTGICVQGESCAIAAPQRSAAMFWPWIGMAVLWVMRRKRGC